jgi:REP element-mobilizing transposase RayT
MQCDNGKHNRRSIRIQGYDYAQAGAYFITICAYQRQCLFGRIVDGRVQLNRWGQIVTEEWLRSEEVRPTVMLDVFVVMPNHLHGIIVLTESVGATRWVAHSEHHDPANVGATRWVAQPDSPNVHRQASCRDMRFHAVEQRATRRVAPTGPTRGSIGAIVGQVKPAVSKRVNALRHTPGATLWQRNYYEHIIRDADDYEEIRWYIENNPARWTEDRENPVLLRRMRASGLRIRPRGVSHPEWRQC